MTFNIKQIFRENLTVQIFILFSLLIFSVSTAFSILTAYYQKQDLLANLEENGRLLMQTLTHSCSLGLFSESPDLLQAPAQGVFHHESVEEVSIFNLNGTPILQKTVHEKALPLQFFATGNNSPDGPPSASVFQKEKIIIEDRANTMVFWSVVLPQPGFDVQTPEIEAPKKRESDESALGFLRITLGKKAMKKQLHEAFLKDAAITLAFLTIGTLLTYFLARRITQPIKRLTDAVNRSGREGEFRKLPVESRNEIGNLAAAFNSMADAIDKKDTEKQILEEKLWQSQKMEAIGTLAGGIAHDFNNILGIITGYCEMALQHSAADSVFTEYLQQVFKAAGRARDLVKQILTFSRKNKTASQSLQLSVIIKEALRMMRASLPSTIKLNQRIQEDLPAVIADPTQIYQVIINLCTNAGHAMQEQGGRLDVSLEECLVSPASASNHPELKPGKYQLLMVQDSGHGMAPSVLDRIFDPFYTTKGPGEGTGMGLSVVHGIVKNHGGMIFADSKLEQGTCFKIYFPSAETTDFSEPEILTAPATGDERLLLVDDEKPLLQTGQQVLSSLGYHITTQTGSIEALVLFENDPQKFDLVITDLTMPNMTGIDLSRRILALRPDIPVILCTGYADAIQVKTIRAIGIREIALKPIIWQNLAQTIRRVLASKKNEQI